eukprot:7823076-Alexandrium_andersonii.AAC.1
MCIRDSPSGWTLGPELTSTGHYTDRPDVPTYELSAALAAGPFSITCLSDGNSDGGPGTFASQGAQSAIRDALRAR